ncbi:MAG: ABC transporter ATP-binding protein [Acidocella sp. 20-57-95]|nr:MAG: ABC transporter ATP-binding protein [Acidocella sp. 20-57-95]HQT63869.1 ATP-binding cassette domain-containing protein [Acidocella sp.]
MTALLAISGLTKRYGGLVAVNNVTFDVQPGEILGLIGPNGSGKSTVMKLIMGIERPNTGAVCLNGVNLAGRPTYEIARAGIGIVFQHSRPLHRQTVLQNILLGLLPDRLTAMRASADAITRATAIAARVGLGHVLHCLPATLPFADLRRMELAKAIARNPRVVLIDEPFAGLTSGEVKDFSDLIVSFRDEGRAVLLVDHNVKSVAAMVDRVIALYLGEIIAQGNAADVMADATVQRVYLGGGITTHERPPAIFAHTQPLLAATDLSVFYGKAQALERINLNLHPGEFVSVVGLNGAGKTTLFNALSGFTTYDGVIHWQGEARTGQSAAAIARAGLVHCPETRELFGDLSVAENIALGGQFLAVAERLERQAWLYGLFPILKARLQQSARTLSGGEQQMLAIARALMMKPKLLILDEPTLGLAPVILGQLSDALKYLREQTDITILLGEQNVTFALPHADRVYVLEHGKMIWEGTPSQFAAEMAGNFLLA